MNQLSKSFLFFCACCTINAAFAFAADRPNILWLTSEDNSAEWIGCYGSPVAKTPNIDRLAEEGFRYTRAYADVSICGPQRSTWITGMLSLTTGTFPMRSRYEIPHERIPYYSDLLSQAGYFVSNHKKTDFNIGGRGDGSAWEDRSAYAWRKRAPGQPFFAIHNFTESHESKAMGRREFNPETDPDPSEMRLAAYHPDLPEVRENYAEYQGAVDEMDRALGEVLENLEKDGLLEETIVIYNSDHGGVMSRGKRFLYQNGLHCPLVIRIPEKYKHLWPNDQVGTTVDSIISFVDMPATWLTLAGAEVPEMMQGRPFLGSDVEARQYHFAYRGRADERIDNQRAVHDGRYLYIKNFAPWTPHGQHLRTLFRQPTSQIWKSEYDAGRTNAAQSHFFEPKVIEELYDTENDPDCVNNLAADPAQEARLANFRQELREWQLEVRDTGMIPEFMRVHRAKKNNLTIYEMAQNPELYPLESYLTAADYALVGEAQWLPQLMALAQDADPGLRFWGCVGLQRLGEAASGAAHLLPALLEDPDHEVRGMAAWFAMTVGQKEAGLKTLQDLLDQSSYATLWILNLADYMGEDAKVLAPSLPNIDTDKTDEPGYVKRMIGYFKNEWR